MAADPANRRASAAVLERAAGLAKISFKLRNAVTVLDDLYQSGSAKIRLPRHHPGEVLEAVLINTSGGMTDGDSFAFEAEWQAGTTAALATQAAERIYKSRGADANIKTQLKIGDGATAFWLPQETIVFDGARLRRHLGVGLSASARFLAAESLIYGRSAMGETVDLGAVHDRFDIAIDGQNVWSDAFAISGEPGYGISALLDRPAIGGGARATATVIAKGPDPESLLQTVRNLAAFDDVHLAATARETLVVARLLAKNGTALRPALLALLGALKAILVAESLGLSNPSALPRVWAS